ncbi:hypothetical protein [Rhodococcus qingshengii]|uniref:hypothetical protein n=1 Tax=Rhodococcus qingshengii TaxID=334542 RepID=UPI001F132D3D|nr:hypothetical protein [Rhodococcus qingshengii]ULD38825.1 hypothetical protein JKI97_00555 [Rhodococcus qingshengii]
MRRLRAVHTTSAVAILAFGGVTAFHNLDERRTPAALPPGVVVDHATCLAPEVLAAAIPVPVRPPELLSDPLPPEGKVPDNFEPTSVVTCQFLEYTDDSSEAILLQTASAGDMTNVVAQLNRESLKSPWFGECPTAASIPPPVVWLVDRAGSAVRVAFPVDGRCRLPLPEVYEAVVNLPVREHQLHLLPCSL